MRSVPLRVLASRGRATEHINDPPRTPWGHARAAGIYVCVFCIDECSSCNYRCCNYCHRACEGCSMESICGSCCYTCERRASPLACGSNAARPVTIRFPTQHGCMVLLHLGRCLACGLDICFERLDAGVELARRRLNGQQAEAGEGDEDAHPLHGEGCKHCEHEAQSVIPVAT